jgi:RloB-like protein
MTFRRNIKIRHVRQRILILCEGMKTEPNYFNSIKSDKSKSNRLSGLKIVIHRTKKNTAKELVDEAIKLLHEAKKEKNPYNEIWVVFDKDGYTKHPESFDRAKAKSINVAFSSPCFEFWYFLHFKYTTAAIKDGDTMCRQLKAHIADYEKAESYYDNLKSHTQTAISNGGKILKHWEESGDNKIWEHNPYTDVGKLVEKLLSL